MNKFVGTSDDSEAMAHSFTIHLIVMLCQLIAFIDGEAVKMTTVSAQIPNLRIPIARHHNYPTEYYNEIETLCIASYRRG